MLYTPHLTDPYLSANETGRRPSFVTVAALESSGIRARGRAPQLLVLVIDGHERRCGGHVWSGTQHGAVRRSVFAMGAATIIGVCNGKADRLFYERRGVQFRGSKERVAEDAESSPM